ncbi:hypothetical protein C7M84_005512 [Penaeus vannamei]|uniref:Uncharacterized protein n=1 Tax=Penaeus vannamei TaxID=6689 RepID=A0A3R7M9T3_PENVA|nr:hypothetical protein C7M84_005512 [Penaeus vannamei]
MEGRYLEFQLCRRPWTPRSLPDTAALTAANTATASEGPSLSRTSSRILLPAVVPGGPLACGAARWGLRFCPASQNKVSVHPQRKLLTLLLAARHKTREDEVARVGTDPGDDDPDLSDRPVLLSE